MPGTADKEFLAVGAVGVGGFGEDVAFVDEVEAGIESDAAGAMEGVGRSWGLVLELEIGMEGGEVERNVGAEVGENPVDQFACFVGIVVEGGDHEIGELEPDGSFVLEPEKGVEYRLKVSEGDFAVESFCEGFEIDVGGVDVVVDVVERFAGDVAVGDHDGFEAAGLGGFADVDNVFAPDGGFVVGKGDGVAAVFAGEFGDLFRWEMPGAGLVVMGFGDVPILAEEAAHIAASSAQAEDARAGEEMVEGLFFDGIDLERGGRGVAEREEFAVLIDTDEAETGLAVADVAVAGAEIAVDAAVGIIFPPAGFVEGGSGLEDLDGQHGGASCNEIIRWWKVISNQISDVRYGSQADRGGNIFS